MEETLYGVPMKSEFYEHIKAEFTSLKQTIVRELADGLDLSDIPPIVSQFVRSAVVIVAELQSSADKEAIILQAFMEFYDQEMSELLPLPESIKAMARSWAQATAKALIALVLPLFAAKPMGTQDPAAAVEWLGFFERRRLGLTLVNVARVLKHLEASGEIQKGQDTATIAAAVANRLVEEKPEEFKAAAGRDWQAFFEAVIAFLEKFIPMLLTILGLFGI